MKACHIILPPKSLALMALCAILSALPSPCQASSIATANIPAPGLTTQASLDNRDMTQLGQRLLRQGDFSQVLSLAEQILAKQGNNKAGLALRAAAYQGNKQSAEFQETAQKFNKLYASSPLLAKTLPTMYSGQGEFAQAERSYHDALRKAPDDAESLLALGYLARQQGQNSQARDHFHQLLKINNLAVKYYLNASYALCRLDLAAHKYNQVIKRADELTRRYPPIGISYQLLASAYLAQGQTAEAIKTYKRLRDITPDSPLPYQELALISAEQTADFSQAIRFANQAVEKNPQDGKSHDIRGWIFFTKQQYKEALPSFQTAVRLAPGNPSYLFHQGLALEKLAKQREAKKSFNAALTLLGRQPSPLRQDLKSALQRCR